MTIPNGWVWVCAPIFLLGCYDIITMLADWWYQMTRRPPE